MLKRCCCCLRRNPEVPPVGFASDHSDKLERKLTLKYRTEKIIDDVTAAFVESTKLQTFSSLTEAYKPGHLHCYWEAVDMLRKFFLVGVVVIFGRGSVLQTVIGTFVSFLFFAFHVKMCEIQTLSTLSLLSRCVLALHS